MVLDLRKRPKQERSRNTVAVNLEAAARIWEAGGLEALTTNAAAERAGVSIGSLYQYFPDKDAILVELIRRERTKLFTEIEMLPSRNGPRSLEGDVRALIRLAVAHQLERPRLARALEYAEASLPLSPETALLAENYRGGLKVTAVRPAARRPARELCQAAICWWACTSGRRFRWRTWPTFSSGPDFAESRSGRNFFILRGDETLYGFLAISDVTKTAQR